MNETNEPEIELFENNWEDVNGPLMICFWILAAGLAKIGFHEAHRIRSRVLYNDYSYYDSLVS